MELQRNIISESIYKLFITLIENQVPFSFVLDNHNNWNIPLPERLHTKKKILFNMDGNSLEDASIIDGKVFFTTDIDNEMYEKIIDNSDLAEILDFDTKKPLFTKVFIETPVVEIVPKGKLKEPTEAEMSASMQVFKKHNANLFA